jgi:hypothetical protein
MPDGKRIDYVKAMEERFYPLEMKTDDNGYRLIVRECGDMVERSEIKSGSCCERTGVPESEIYRRQVYEKLGLDPNEKPTKKIETTLTFLQRYEKEHPEMSEELRAAGCCGPTAPTFETFPMLKDWLEENTPGLNLLAEAIQKPVFCIPYVRKNENTPIVESVMRLDELQMMKGWYSAVLDRAKYRLGIGDIDGAIDDIVTIHRLGRHAGRQGPLSIWGIGVTLEGGARTIGIGKNPEFSPTKEQIERLVAELNALPPRYTLNEALEVERLFGLASFQDMRWGNSPYTLHPWMVSWSFDINILLEKANQVYDVMIEKSMTFDGKELEDILTQELTPSTLLFVRSRTNLFANTMSSLLIPSIQSARESWRRAECAENMQRLTFALLLYEKEHGKLPEGDWRVAIRPYLGENPDKYFLCPSHKLEEGYTSYAMVGDVPNMVASPLQILLVEVSEPQKFDEGDGRIPFEQAQFGRENGLSSIHPVGIHAGVIAGFRSGAVHFIEKKTKPEEWQQLLDGTATALP